MIVLDASVVVELLRGSPAGIEAASAIGEEPVAAPDLVYIEVASVLRRLVALGRWDETAARLALSDLLELDLAAWPPQPLVERAFELRAALTSYDAMYVALAEALDAPLLTLDAALAGSNGHQATIRLIA